MISVDKKVAGFYKIYKKIGFPKISKKSIKKTTPVKMNKQTTVWRLLLVYLINFLFQIVLKQDESSEE